MATRETENYAYAKFWGDKQRALQYVMVFSGVVNFLTKAWQVWSQTFNRLFVLFWFIFFIDAPLNEVNIMGYKTGGRPVTVISQILN